VQDGAFNEELAKRLESEKADAQTLNTETIDANREKLQRRIKRMKAALEAQEEKLQTILVANADATNATIAVAEEGARMANILGTNFKTITTQLIATVPEEDPTNK